MPHITFIHGIANKPPADELLQIWRRALAEGDEPLPLADLGVTSSMVYWADLMYAAPDSDTSAYEGVLENSVQAVDAGGGARAPQGDTAAEQAFLAALRQRLCRQDDAAIDAAIAAETAAARSPGHPARPPQAPVPPGATAAGGAGTLERIPLPWFLKKPLMEVLLRDVHHYLFNKTFAPPGRSAVPIQQTIRQRFVQALAAVPAGAGRHVVVSHSMGTVIAYDCLQRVDGCPRVDGLVTLGSPLGLDEVQDQLRPGWSRDAGFPAQRLAGDWFNAFDRLDPVCGFDPQLANDYGRAGAAAVQDAAVTNSGAWRHTITKYLRQPVVSRALRRMLGV